MTRPSSKPSVMRPMQGGGERYEKNARLPAAESLVLGPRKERIEAVLDLRTRNLCVALDRLEDSFNMAAVMRTTEAMGIQDLHVVKNPEYPWSPNHTVTQGCDKWLDLHPHQDWAACARALKAKGFKIFVSSVGERAVSLLDLDFSGKCALVFGNERHGVSEAVLESADQVFWIPMRGFTQSLNISAAASAAITRAIAWRKERLGIEGDLSRHEREVLREKFMRLSVKQRGKLYGTRRPA